MALKLLFISGAGGPDYLCDMLLHGFRTLLGPDAVDMQPPWYMYASSFGEGGRSLSDLPGRGMSLYGLLPDLAVDRGDMAGKIRSRYFDLVVLGGLQCPAALAGEVWSHYPPRDVVILDGEEHTGLGDCLGRGIYFKRELASDQPGVHPIEFCIPQEKISSQQVSKTRMLAACDPRRPSSCVFPDETSYYGEYQKSFFGVTIKGGAWDCLRHYEILANHCVPLFLELAACPGPSLFRFPKKQNLALVEDWQKRGPDWFLGLQGEERYMELSARMFHILRNQLTTTAMARYVLDVWTRTKQGKA